MIVRGTQDLGVPRREHLLVPEERLFGQALARSDAGVADFDVAPHLEPGKTNQVCGQVHDPNRLAHIEDEDLAALA